MKFEHNMQGWSDTMPMRDWPKSVAIETQDYFEAHARFLSTSTKARMDGGIQLITHNIISCLIQLKDLHT
jgi:hypothetical protein